MTADGDLHGTPNNEAVRAPTLEQSSVPGPLQSNIRHPSPVTHPLLRLIHHLMPGLYQVNVFAEKADIC